MVSFSKKLSRALSHDGRTKGDRRREAEAKETVMMKAEQERLEAEAAAKAAAEAEAERQRAEAAAAAAAEAAADSEMAADSDPPATAKKLKDAWRSREDGITPADSVSQVAQSHVGSPDTEGPVITPVVRSLVAGAGLLMGSVLMQRALDPKKAKLPDREPEQFCLAPQVSEKLGYRSVCVRTAEGGPNGSVPQRQLPRLVLDKIDGNM